MTEHALLNRRHALGALASLAGAAGLPARARSAPSSPEDFYREFAAALARDRRLLPFAGARGDLRTDRLDIEGHWPSGLRGRFWRNGPALFERAGQRYQHWFAGDGMVQRFTLADDGVSHLGRFVRTEKFQRESEAGRFQVMAFGTALQPEVRVNGPDSVNTANTNVIEHGGRVLAMWEGGSAHALDRPTLDTLGPVTWREGWAQMPFSAHPKIDADGHLWNIGGTVRGGVAVYHVAPDGRLVDARMVKLPLDGRRGGDMLHDMTVSQRFVVLPIPPLAIRWERILQGELGPEAMALVPGEPLRVWVAPKDALDRGRLFELPPMMVFHVGHAHEEGDDIVFSFVGDPDNGFLGDAAMQVMRGRFAQETGRPRLRVARLDWRSGRARLDTLAEDTQVEFPRVDPRRIGRPLRHVATTAAWTGRPAATAQMNGVMVCDIASGRTQRFDYGADHAPEEHLWVPKPGAGGELDAWLVATSFHTPSGRTCLNVLDAARVADGPLARAWLPYALPLGFHGHFEAA